MTSALAIDMIKRYPKAICHLNQAKNDARMGLILGSGISGDLHLPRWEELIDKLEVALSYTSPGSSPPSYKAEQLFQHYRAKTLTSLGLDEREKAEAAVNVGWRKVVANVLYQSYAAGGALNEEQYSVAIRKHPYIGALAKLARSIRLVVTHNFDDALERAIDEDPQNPDQEGRRYHSFWRPEPFLRRPMVNIYHPNGFTPFNSSVKGSDSLILTEASFADHLADTNTPESHFLLRHLADKTWLIIGHSLADGTLKNALRLHANQRPGHVNYYVHWEDAELDANQKQAIREANFCTYNLVTIFANSEEIRALIELIDTDPKLLVGEFERADKPAKYVYYIAGTVSSGKSTVLGHMRDLATVEEWPRKMPPTMNKHSTHLTQDEQQKIDQGLEVAIWTKNSEVLDIKVGLVAVDRAPLDYLAFPTSENETIEQTAISRTFKVLERLAKTRFRNLCEGQVILIRASVSELIERQLKRGRTTPEEVKTGVAKKYLERQQLLLSETYDDAIRAGSSVDADRCSIARSAKDTARIIHLADYTPFPFEARLRRISGFSEAYDAS